MNIRHHSRALAILVVILLATPLALAAPADERLAKVDAVFAQFDKPNSPGCAVGVVQNGNFLYKRGYGLGSIELQVPLTPSSVFYMGSVSKQFTAASVVLAQELGLLSLDDDVRKWVPELPDYGHRITLRHMLHHTSGLRDVLALLALAGQHAEDVHPLPEFIDLVARQKQLNYTPGDEYLYSNSNFVLLAEIVHRASGKPFSQFAEENIFRPLGMTHTRFYDDHSVVLPGRVAAYAPGSGGFRVDWSTNFEKVGDGGLMSSVEDLLLWDRNFYDNKLGKGTLLKEMHTKGVLNSGKPIDYALGLVISEYKGLPTVEHGGALFGYRTDILRFPEQKFSVITLCNLATATPGVYAQKVADIFLADKFKSDAPQKRAEASSGFKTDVQAFAGSYRYLDDHSPMTLDARDGALSLRNAVLRPTAANRFVDPNGGQFAFAPSPGGTMRLTVTSSSGTERVAERYETAKLTPAELAEYAGDYSSDELLVTYKLRVKDGKLTMTAGWNDPIPLDPTVRDDFRGRGGIVSFVRQNGKLAGFDLYAGRVRNIRFVKK